MKLLVVNDSAGDFELMADSALVLSGRPVFVPDIPEVASWQAQPMVAVRVSRLGKSVGRKFASRYYDALTLALRLMPLDADGREMKGIASLVDFGLAVGQWTDVETMTEGEVSFGDDRCNLGAVSELAHDMIVGVSRMATLKIGDILLSRLPLAPRGVEPGTKVSLALGDSPLLETKIR